MFTAIMTKGKSNSPDPPLANHSSSIVSIFAVTFSSHAVQCNLLRVQIDDVGNPILTNQTEFSTTIKHQALHL